MVEEKTLECHNIIQLAKKWNGEIIVLETISESPLLALKVKNKKWKISICLGPYKKWEKQNLSPSIYDKYTIWPEYYRMCKYYYDKYRKSI